MGGSDRKSNIFLGFMAGHCLFTLLKGLVVFFLVALLSKQTSTHCKKAKLCSGEVLRKDSYVLEEFIKV